MLFFSTAWTLIHILNQVTAVASGVIVDLYLWEQTKSLPVILLFNLGIFIVWPLSALISSVLSEYLGLKLNSLLGIILTAFFILYLLYTPDAFSQPFSLGMVKGLAVGFTAPVGNIILNKLGKGHMAFVASRNAAWEQLVEVVVPPLMAFSIFFVSSYRLMISLGLASCLAAFIVSLLTVFPSTDRRFSFADIFPFNDTNPEKSLLAKLSFLDGIRQGFFYSLLGIIIYYFTGDLKIWGIFVLLSELFSFFFDWFYSRYFEDTDALISLGFSATFFMFASVIFIANFDLLGLVVFALGYRILMVTFGINLETSIAKIQELDLSHQDLEAEYAGFQEICRGLGRLLPILFLLFANVGFDQPGILVGTIIAVGLIPFAMVSVLSRSYVLKHLHDLSGFNL